MNANSSQVPDKLAPDMASFRLLVFAAVRDYIGLMGDSPSYGEVANKLKCGRTRVREAVKSLARDGLLIRTPGPRGLKLPSVRDEAIRQLRALGYVVDEDIGKILPPPNSLMPRAHPTLLPPPELDYPHKRTGDIDGERGAEAGRGTAG